MKLKYIRHSTLGFVLWPAHNETTNNVSHRDMAQFVQRALVHELQRFSNKASNDPGCVTSAGFAHVHENGTAHCFGKSESLDMYAQPGDSKALQAQLFGDAPASGFPVNG